MKPKLDTLILLQHLLLMLIIVTVMGTLISLAVWWQHYRQPIAVTAQTESVTHAELVGDGE